MRVVPGVSGVRQLAVGPEHACAVRTTGAVLCWGRRFEEFHTGRLPTRRQGLRMVRGLFDATAVAVGRLHACALRRTGKVACWGYNRHGQLGDGTSDSRGALADVDIGPAVAIAAGRDHACALAADGGVQCWGGHFARDLQPCPDGRPGRCAVRHSTYGMSPGPIPLTKKQLPPTSER